MSESHSRLFATVHELYSPWNSPDQNTGVGSLSLLQGVFWFKGNALGQIPFALHVYRVSPEMDTRTLTIQQVIQQGASRLL